jgi:hypothetical protein
MLDHREGSSTHRSLAILRLIDPRVVYTVDEPEDTMFNPRSHISFDEFIGWSNLVVALVAGEAVCHAFFTRTVNINNRSSFSVDESRSMTRQTFISNLSNVSTSVDESGGFPL